MSNQPTDKPAETNVPPQQEQPKDAQPAAPQNPAHGYPQYPGYPPHGGYPPHPGYPPHAGYPPQPGYPLHHGGYPPHAGYPPQQHGGYPAPQASYPPQQPSGYPTHGDGGGYGGGYGGGHGGLGSKLESIDFQKVDTVGGQFQYYEHKVNTSAAEVDKWRQEHQITMIGDNAPEPMMEFMDLAAPEAVHRAFKDQGFDRPTPIQAQSWPILLQSRDLIGVAKTGSGKTLAFIIPAILHINAQPPLRLGDGPIALVLAPTRELATQIEEETRKVSGRCALQVVCLYGGAPKHPQMRALRAGAHIAVATPGRLIDMLEARATNLLRVTYLVLDEADRMLDMGFEPQVRKICSQIRPDRQTLMFSATWPQEVRSLASSFMREPLRLHIGSTELMANADVRQHIVMLNSDFEKFARLVDIVRQAGRVRIIVFTKTKRACDDVHHELRRAGFNAMAIHGDKEQRERDRVLARLKHENDAVLVATDVAARGLDVKNLEVVVNFDFPTNIEDYVHRIGRTGRAGKTGDAYSFIVQEAPKLLRDLRDILAKANQPIPPELMMAAGPPAGRGRRGGGGRNPRFGGGRGGGYPPRDAYGGSYGMPHGAQYGGAPPIAGYGDVYPKRDRSPGGFERGPRGHRAE